MVISRNRQNHPVSVNIKVLQQVRTFKYLTQQFLRQGKIQQDIKRKDGIRESTLMEHQIKFPNKKEISKKTKIWCVQIDACSHFKPCGCEIMNTYEKYNSQLQAIEKRCLRKV